MEYTLLTGEGKIMQSYLRSLAETYRKVYGGVVFSQQELKMVDNSTECAILTP